MLAQTIDAVMRSPSLDTAVTILNKCPFEHLMSIVEIKVMDNPIAEMGGKYLTTFGVGDDEAIRRQRLIGAVPQSIAK